MPFTSFAPPVSLWPGPSIVPNPNLGIVAENYPNIFASVVSGVIGAGIPICVRFDMPAVPVNFSNLVYAITGAGATLTAGENFAGLYDNNGNQIGVSADQSGVWVAAGIKTNAISGGPFNTGRWPFIVAAFLFNGTTAPTFARAAGAGLGVPIVNMSAPTASLLAFANGSALTSLPASMNYASNTTGAGNPQYIWCGLS